MEDDRRACRRGIKKNLQLPFPLIGGGNEDPPLTRARELERVAGLRNGGDLEQFRNKIVALLLFRKHNRSVTTRGFTNTGREQQRADQGSVHSEPPSVVPVTFAESCPLFCNESVGAIAPSLVPDSALGLVRDPTPA